MVCCLVLLHLSRGEGEVVQVLGRNPPSRPLHPLFSMYLITFYHSLFFSSSLYKELPLHLSSHSPTCPSCELIPSQIPSGPAVPALTLAHNDIASAPACFLTPSYLCQGFKSASILHDLCALLEDCRTQALTCFLPMTVQSGAHMESFHEVLRTGANTDVFLVSFESLQNRNTFVRVSVSL